MISKLKFSTLWSDFITTLLPVTYLQSVPLDTLGVVYSD